MTLTEFAETPQIKYSVSLDCPSSLPQPQMPAVKVQVVICASDQIPVSQRFSRPPLQVGHLLEQLTEVRETHLPVYYIIKEMIKDMDEQPDEDTHRARF